MATEGRQMSRGPYEARCEAQVTFCGPLHVGTGQRLATTTDAPLLRDVNNRVWLPGSSVRGVIRDWCEREAPLVGADSKAVERLFGVTPPVSDSYEKPARDNDRQGRLRTFDAALDVAAPTETRDHGRLSPQWGAADTGAKFDHEIALPRSATLRWIYEGCAPEDIELALLRSIDEPLAHGVLGFGAKSGWGFGAVRCPGTSWTACDRRTTKGLSDYLRSRLPGGTSSALPMRATPPKDATLGLHPNPKCKPWSWLSLDLCLQFDGPMLVAGPWRGKTPAGPESAADATYFIDARGHAVLPGSSLRGVLRATAAKIAGLCGRSDLARELFGYQKRTKDGKELGRRGLLAVREGRLTGQLRVLPFNHVAIDRVSGFAADKKLFSTAALISPRFDTTIVLRWHADNKAQRAAIGLLLMTLREAIHGLLWCGSRTTRGYGHLSSATVTGARYSLVESGGNGWKRHPLQSVDGGAAALSQLGDLDAVLEAWREPLS